MDWKYRQLWRRCGLALGMALLVGGWSVTGYAHEQQQVLKESKRRLWFEGYQGILIREGAQRPEQKERKVFSASASRNIYRSGMILMFAGAGIAAFSFPKIRE